MSKKILCGISEWGYWGEELVGPVEVLDAKGYEIVFMTPKGERPHALPPSMEAGFFDPPLDKVVTDEYCLNSKYGKIKMLLEHNVKTFIFDGTSCKKMGWAPLMHNKFAIIDNNIWTGSFNWTVSANIQNQENAIYTDNKKVHQRFLAHFKKLKKRCKALFCSESPS